ncbi:hypothetical protein GOP47_0002451, partial [Adiantum capillus-veneris]
AGTGLLGISEGLKEDEHSSQKVELPTYMLKDQDKMSSFRFLVQAGYSDKEALKAVQNSAMIESMKKLDVPIITSNEKLQTPTKLGKVFTLSKKRKVDSEMFKAVRQLDFEPRTVKKVQQKAAIEDARMTIHMLIEVHKFLSSQQIQLDNQ